MAALLGVRIVIFVVLMVVLLNWPFLYVLSACVLTVWAVPVAIRGGLKGKTPDDEKAAFAEFLQADLREASQEIARLNQEVEDARNRASASNGGPRAHSSFRRVGLDQASPRWLIEASRKQWRLRLHPDTKPEIQKLEATRRFQDAENCFEEIWRLRGFDQR